jgi:hypothetical protein
MRGGAALTPLELPRREAPDVDVVLVHAGVVAVALELDLELHLLPRYRLAADHTCSADAWAAPRAIRSAARKFATLNGLARLHSENLFVGHLAVPRRARTRGATRYEREAKPDAVGEDASRARQTGPMGGNFRVAPSHSPGQAARC